MDGVELYRTVYGEERAVQLWEDAFEHYRQEIAYYAQFRGDKAIGVRGPMQNDLQIIGLLSDMARITLGNDTLCAKAENLLTQYGARYE